MSQNFLFCIFQITSLPRTQVCACYVASVTSKSLQCHQASLSMGILQAILECVAIRLLYPWGFSMQYWSVLPYPPPGDLPDQELNLCLFSLLHWQAGSLPLAPPQKPMDWGILTKIQCWNPTPNVMVFGDGGFGGEVIIAGPSGCPYEKRHCRICFLFLFFMWGHSEKLAIWQLRRESLENPVTLYFNNRLFILQNNKK